MDKLIDYEGLGTFQTNLLNDNKVSPIATWSSEKISEKITTELGAKQDALIAEHNISIDASNKISALGYKVENGGFAEGYNTTVKGVGAHAEGMDTTATGNATHAEGMNTYATRGAHAEGYLTHANGYVSHAEGRNTVTNNVAEHAEGHGNISHTKTHDTFGNKENTLHSIGIGKTIDDTITRKNAVEVMQNGDYYLYGVGNYDGVHIKNEQGAPANTQTLQNVISGLNTTINGLNTSINSLNTSLSGKQDVLIAGDNITITDNYIDAKGYWYDSVLEHSTKDIIFHIVGNKIDLLNKEEVDRNGTIYKSTRFKFFYRRCIYDCQK